MIKTILFDVDGVFLSEERCFDASALSVWELLYNPAYLGLTGEVFTPDPTETGIRRIRDDVFAQDEVLNFVKNRGINSNWDMVFLSTAHQILRILREVQPHHPEWIRRILSHDIQPHDLQALGRTIREMKLTFTPAYTAFTTDFSHSNTEKQAIFHDLNHLAQRWLNIPTHIFSQHSALWQLSRAVYQEWYLGDAYYARAEKSEPRTPGKPGFMENEIPLGDPDEIRGLLRHLREDKGLKLGIGTGRPALECEVPLRDLGFWDYFEPGHVVTASDVVSAEAAFPDNIPLGKPQPFTYIKALYGQSAADQTCIEAPLPIENGAEILVVGDSVADYMAARSMGCQFAATLTGLSGQKARGKFEELGADYICDDVLKLRDIF